MALYKKRKPKTHRGLFEAWKQTKEILSPNMEHNRNTTRTNVLTGYKTFGKPEQFNSQCPQTPRCPPLSSSFWPCWDSSGIPDCRSAHCSSYGPLASMCSFSLYPCERGKDSGSMKNSNIKGLIVQTTKSTESTTGKPYKTTSPSLAH